MQPSPLQSTPQEASPAPDSEAVAKLEVDVIKLRIEGIKDALTRSRVAFLVTTIISLMMILGTWNSYFSWDRDFAWIENWPEGTGRDEVIAHLQKKWLEAWLSNQQIAVPLLGIRVSTSDATFLASVALVVAIIWFFWCTRRENHSIAQLLEDTINAPIPLRRLVYHGIAANLVFVYLSHDDTARSSLKKKGKGRPFTLMRRMVRGLSYLPPFAILFCGAVQLIYVFMESPFRKDLPYQNHNLYISVVSVIALASIVITLLVGHRVNLFQDGIKKMMHLFAEDIPELRETHQ